MALECKIYLFNVPGKMQENLELSLLKNILIIIRVVRWEVVETHVIFTRSGQAQPTPS